MIRKVELSDAKGITEIYNKYILDSTITFETEPLQIEEMLSRIQIFASKGPYLVYEENGEIAGYCYAHAWKEKAAYKNTFETTIYLSDKYKGKGYGTLLMNELIEECRKQGIHALIACVTEGNTASDHLHLKLGFKQVSRFEEVGQKFGKWLDVIDYELVLDKKS